MMNDRSFRIVACLDVNQGQLPAFKSLVEKMALKVETSELRTLDYEWYLSGDGSQCYVSDGTLIRMPTCFTINTYGTNWASSLGLRVSRRTLFSVSRTRV
jgi:hypothetical protein